MSKNKLTTALILTADPESLVETLAEEFLDGIPSQISTIEEMNLASMQMSKIVGYLQFLEPQLTILKIKTQNLKASGEKEDYKLMMQRRDCLDTICEILKLQRDTISRMLTVKQEINKEMRL